MQRLCHVYLGESKIPANKRFARSEPLSVFRLKGSLA